MAKIKAQVTDPAAEVEFDYEFGDSLEKMIELFGKEIVTSYALRGLTIAAQGAARGLIRGGKSGAEIVEAMKTWKPGEPRVTKSPEEKVKALLDRMSPEDRKRLAAELTASKPQGDETQPAKGKKA